MSTCDMFKKDRPNGGPSKITYGYRTWDPGIFPTAQSVLTHAASDGNGGTLYLSWGLR